MSAFFSSAASTRTFRQQAVFVSVSEQKLAERQQIGVVPVGLGARRARTIPVETRLRASVDESEGLVAAHVAGRKDIDLRQAGASAPVSAFCRLMPRAARRPARNRIRRMCGSLSPMPQSHFPRGVLADVAQVFASGSCRLPCLRRIRAKSAPGWFVDVERQQTRGSESDLIRFVDVVFVITPFLLDRSVEPGRSKAAQPLPRRVRLANAQQHVTRGCERVESGFGDRLDVVWCRCRVASLFCRRHISASQRRISSSLM